MVKHALVNTTLQTSRYEVNGTQLHNYLIIGQCHITTSAQQLSNFGIHICLQRITF